MDGKLYRVIEWLHGKKLIIFGIIALTNNFLALKGVYDNDTNTFIGGLLLLFGGTTDVVTGKMTTIQGRRK